MFKLFLKTFALLLDVASWFLGTLFVGDIVTFVNGDTWTTGLGDLAFSTFLVAVFFLVKMMAETVMDNLDIKERAKKTSKKKAKKSLKVRHVLKKNNSNFSDMLKSKKRS